MEVNLVSSLSFTELPLTLGSVQCYSLFSVSFWWLVHKMTLDFSTTSVASQMIIVTLILFLFLLKGISKFLEVFDLMEGKQQLVHTKSH